VVEVNSVEKHAVSIFRAEMKSRNSEAPYVCVYRVAGGEG
jgi:hypothetical protein